LLLRRIDDNKYDAVQTQPISLWVRSAYKSTSTEQKKTNTKTACLEIQVTCQPRPKPLNQAEYTLKTSD